MSAAVTLIAAAALLPAMTAPASAEHAREAAIALCGDGAISIPLDGAPAPGDGAEPCAKGCHAGQSRKRLDRTQCA